MKQEASKKNKKWLWIVLGLVALLAVAGVVLALVFGGGSGDTEKVKGGRPDLYWNVARQSHLDPATSLSNRDPAADGLFYVTFAHNGEQVEYAVADKKTVNYIDSMDIMGLVFDNDGLVVDVIDPLNLATEVGKGLYVQNVSGNMLVANSSIAMNGMRFNINITEKTEIYEVSGAGEFEGVKIEPAELLAMDTITIYANDLEEVTHIYLIDHPDESKVYWRATQQWNSKEKMTAREPDENGDYTMDFFCEGELVYFKTKDVAIATKIDNASRYSAHFGLRFDEDGYIVEVLNSAIASRTMLACQRFDITEFDGETFTATRLLTNDGSSYTGTVTADTRIYDVSGAASAEGRKGKAVDSIQMGDRVCVWTDPNGNVVLIYVANRLVDSPAYYLESRKYSSKTGETTLEPNAQGVYEVELLREGDNKKTIYKTTDKDLMTQIHKPSDKCVGLKVDENNNIQCVYDVEALFGNTYFCRGRFVSEAAGMIASFMLPSDLSVKNGVLAANCKFYNVSKVGEYGAETALQVGDYVYCWKQPSGEILHGYVIRRYIGEETQYYNLVSKYDKETMTSTRKPAEDGWYYFEMANQGKKVTLKTKDKALVDAIDTLGKSLPCMTLKVSGDVILEVMDPLYSTGGAKIASGYKIKSFNADGSITAVYKEKEVTFTLADNAQIYNVSAVVDSHQGEKGTMKIGDMITAFTNIEGKATIVWVRSRQVENMYWKLDRFYDSTNEVTKREPDADGWYWYDLAVNGEIKRLKTKDKTIANSMDSYEGAFGLHVVGDEIKGFVSAANVKDCSGNGVTNWTVSKVNGNKVTLVYTLPGTSEGKTQEITLASNAKIYDVSDTAEKFGAKTTLKVGDFVRTYLSEDGKTHQYVYVRAHCTRKDGYMSYCDHCDKLVYWTPLVKNSSMSKNDSHYYLPADVENTSQISIGSESRDYENVLDLNGHDLTRVGGRAFLIRYLDTLTIIDSVGGGSITGTGHNASGGTVMVSSGGRLNLYAGDIRLTDDENVMPGYGGNIHLTGKDSVFNMYGGTLSGGRSYMTSTYSNARGGNLYVSASTFNMYGGTIIGGKSFDGQKPLLDKDGNPELNADGKPKTERIRSYGGNVYVATGGVLNITGGTITEGWAEGYGGNISSNSTANKVNLIGATITNGSANYRGGNLSAGYGTWLIDGGTKITGGYAGKEKSSGYGGNMMINYADVTVNKALIDDATVAHDGTGGNIYCLYDGSLTLNKGAVVSNGTSNGMGGNIYVAGNQYVVSSATDRKFTLTINGGTVTGGTSVGGNGGNIAMSGYSIDIDGDGKKEYVGGSNFYMLGGEVSNGTCPDGKYGGNLYLQVDEAKISGGKIFGGKQGDNEYDIYVPGDGTGITVSGGEVAGKFRVNALDAITIEGNPVLGQLNLAKDAMITVGELKSDAKIAVMVTATTPGGVFTNAFSKAQDYYNAGYFTAYEAGKMVYFTADNELCVVTERLIDPNAYTAHCEHCQQNVEWSEWSYLSGSGHYYLNDTYTLVDSPVIIAAGEDIVIDLKGKSITAQDDLAFDVAGTLSVMDSATGGMITGSGPSSGTATGGVIRVNGGTLNLYSGILKMTDNQNNMAGGGVVYTTSGATFNMYGGELAGGDAFGNPNSTNTNTQKGRGGNLYNTGSVSNLMGGKIYGGKAGIGGNIYNGSSGEINFMGTEIYGGEATKGNGGNIFSESGKLTFSGSSITGGTAASTGSNVYLNSASLTVEFTDGTFDGEIYARSVSSVKVSGAPTIENLRLHSSVLLTLGEMTGGTVKIAADGVFTGVLNNADAYLTYITAFESGKKVAVTTAGELTVVDDSSSGGGNEGQEPVDPTQTPFNDVYTNAVAMTTNGVFNNATTVSAPCPYCSAKGDTADKEWTALTAVTGSSTTLSGGHYFVAESITGNTGYYKVSGNACLHLNGNDISSSERVFHVEGAGTLNVMGDGIVTGAYKSSSKAYYAATLDSVGTVNLCGGTWKRANDAPVVDGRGTSAEGVISVYNGTTIQGDSNYTGYALIALSQKTEMNMYGGTVTGGTWTNGTGGNIYIMANTYADRYTALNIYGGTISGGSANKGGNIYAQGGTSNVTVLISGGSITGGSVYAENNVTSLTVTGTPVIENLDLSAGTVIDLGTLSGTASVAVTADGVFTNALANANDYLTYVTAFESDKKVEVTTSNTLSVVADSGAGEEEEAPTATPFNDVYAAAVQQTANGVFDNASTVTAPCPYCSANGDTADKEWTALTAVTGTKVTLSEGHYFLADSITDNAGYYEIGSNVCVHLNGKDITTAAEKLAFYANAEGSLNVMGEGTITGGRRNSSKPTWAATLENIGTVNLCGGTWKRANNSPVLGSRGTGTCKVNIYNGTTIQGDSNYTEYALISVAGNTDFRMYGGTITGGTWTSGNGGNIRVFNSANAERVSSVTIYGGLITGGSATLGGNIYVEGGSSGNTNLEIAGGTITDGSVYVKKAGSTLTVSGNAQVENLDLSDGTILNVSNLSDIAHIGITATGVFTDVLTNANDYLNYIKAYEVGKEIVITSDQKLYIQADVDSYANGYCPCGCGLKLDQIQWTSISFDADPTADYKIQANGHYRLESDVRGNAGNLIRVYADKVVFDMNGKQIENKGRAFYHGDNANCDLYILDTVGTATVTTIDYSDSLLNNGGLTGCWFYTKGTLSIYGGSWSSTTTVAGTSTSSPRMGIVNTGTLNIYGGTFDATGVDAACGIMGAYKETASTMNIYGGTFIEGNGSNLGDIFRVNAASTLDIRGGEFQGQIYAAAAESTILVSGDVQINDLDLTQGAKVTFGMLTKDASIVLNGTGELTAANVNAQTYVDAGYISAYDASAALTVEENVIIVTAASNG